MKIVEADVIVTCPGRNYVTLKLTTDDGIVGYGDATLNGRELAVSAYLTEHVVPLLIGRDANRINDTWQYLYRGAYWRRGPVTMTAIGAVDIALWDIQGKALGRPVYQLLGGAARDGVMIYGHASGATIDETVADAARFLEAGYLAVRVQAKIPGLDATYGIRTGSGLTYEPAVGDLPAEEVWDTAAYLDFAGRTPGQVARAVPDVLARGRDAGRGPGGVPADPPAHGHPAGGRRGLQLDLGLPGAHRRAAHRLHPHGSAARRWDHPLPADLRLCRPLRGTFRLARPGRRFADRHRRRAASRPCT